MIDNVLGTLLVVVGLVATAYAIGWTQKPFAQLAIFLAGMASTIGLLVGFSRAVK